MNTFSHSFKIAATIPLQFDTAFSPFLVSEYESALSWLRENGFDGIEPVVARPKEMDGVVLRATLDEYGLQAPTISTGQAFGLDGISLTDENDDIRNKAVMTILEHIDLAKQINAPNITIGLIRGKASGMTENTKPDVCLARLRESLSECLPYAISNGVRLMLEPINRYETEMLNSCEDTAKFIQTIPGAGDNLGILYDTFHSNIEDSNMVHTIRGLGPLIFHVHFADSNRSLPGEGHINFCEIIEALESIGYTGFISLETLNRPDRKYIKEHAATRIRGEALSQQ